MRWFHNENSNPVLIWREDLKAGTAAWTFDISTVIAGCGKSANVYYEEISVDGLGSLGWDVQTRLRTKNPGYNC